MRFTILRQLFTILIAIALPLSAFAQGQLTPVIRVNDQVVTQYELTQRIRLLEAFNTAGDLPTLAREALIEDRLKQQEMARFGVTISEEGLQAEMEQFSSRANLSLDEFANVLASDGIDLNTLRDFVEVGVLWRNFVRSRFSRSVSVTDADIDRARRLQDSGPTQLEVLLNEIIIGVTPERAARAAEVARQISALRSFERFEDAARQVSALPSRERGGRMDWVAITNFPPPIQRLILDLEVGEVTEPIDITNGIALFQMRGRREATRDVPAPVSIDYAAYYVPGGQTDAGRAAAQGVIDQIDTCDDLYGVARNQPAEVLDRVNLPPSEIATDIALELARLDPGEISTALTANNGETLVLLMLCERVQAGAGDVDDTVIRNQLRSQRLAALADALVEDLRAAADIR